VEEGATAELGLGRLAQASRPGPFRRRLGPPFLEREDDATLSSCGRRHLQKKSHSPKRLSTS
jgi:hypothetical protein